MGKSKEKWKVYKNVFSEFSRKNLFKLTSEGHFEELKTPIFIGKEANIFSARTKDETQVIVKIYRLENCNFNKMYEYIAADPRYLRTKKQKRSIVFSWTQREFKNLMIAREAIRVPTPITFKSNILVMEMIGDPAPMLKDKRPKKPKEFLKKIVVNIQKLKERGLVHGDLSEFNILNHDEEPIFIDFSQGTLLISPNAYSLYDRDLNNIRRFFKKMISEKEIEEVIKSVQ
ncbi:MAG: serine protein kinase RIO [Nanoarchaeota archaeon]|nr:serine protein kinase RIO [Nanoarchaeota archaeon]MBU1269560.1 serine protein kinase RIO [Nanoarchaeota archaeon]MBU1604708.1 serine protein kinase RIO [Nanoarchaeota archaeon]MBU2443821.1 serine protein kinase RIO [Nanoarchaeota archaeon]